MKKRITYTHETDPERTLEVVGEEYAMPAFAKIEGRTYIRSIDDYIIDFPTANILTETVITE